MLKLRLSSINIVCCHDTTTSPKIYVIGVELLKTDLIFVCHVNPRITLTRHIQFAFRNTNKHCFLRPGKDQTLSQKFILPFRLFAIYTLILLHKKKL